MENKFDVRNTRTGDFTEALKTALRVHNDLHQDGLVGGVAHISLDTSDPEVIPSGMVMLYNRDAKVHPSDIPNTLGQYLMVSELLPRPQGYKDADFHSEEARRALNENIPQFNQDPPSFDLRHPRTNMDIDAWGPELGQEDGVVGVYKVLEPNGRDARYYLAVRSSIPEVVHKFKQDLVRSPAMQSGEMTFGDLMSDKRLHYVDYMGRRNGYKLMYAAMKALGVAIPHGIDGDHYVPAQSLQLDDDSTAKPMRAEPEHVHAITTIEPLIQGGHERIAIYNGVSPSHQCGERCFAFVSPYDGIVRFNMNSNGTGLAMPVVTGRRTPETPAEDVTEDILRRAKQSSIIWEQSAKYPAHPDLHPDGHYQVDKPFLRSMQQSGWRREDERDLMVPVLLKISNPALRRQK